ncbi:hypothetical protein CC1G_09281 [Coprinopsis cinerea okayama7|uniref:DUF6533 domain-containing protein n=1 Tax=Coprinopsis cinerea (strain Okayama-7 / 130 / ATCC MYA-4618 / FGSC 9003) TaxID=240176 RepID=A8N860_COPC7|nr:hypothetical protein CC1G_09281 [Coprinopsis cinerea okayama7\|eukprot:XP_001831016.2 hypothetical protein CC1G_09281 [Coprinopsis cinerea okayama7\
MSDDRWAMFLGALKGLRDTEYVSWACIAVAIYDYFLTFVEEVESVWRSRWSIGVSLFYLNRYLVFVDQALLAEWAIVNGISVSHAEFRTNPNGQCLVTGSANYVFYTYLLICITEFITIGFTIAKAGEHIRRARSSWVVQLYRSGIIHCIVIFILSISNMVLPKLDLQNRIYIGIMTRPQRVMESILCNRVLFVIFRHRRRRSRSRQLGHGHGQRRDGGNIDGGGDDDGDEGQWYTETPTIEGEFFTLTDVRTGGWWVEDEDEGEHEGWVGGGSGGGEWTAGNNDGCAGEWNDKTRHFSSDLEMTSVGQSKHVSLHDGGTPPPSSSSRTFS